MGHKGRPLLTALGVVALVAVYLTLTLGTAAQKSAHFDETAHVVAGYFADKYDDYRVDTSNMILGQRLAAWPLLSSSIKPPSEGARQHFFDRSFMDAFSLGTVFLYESGNDPQAILFRGRAMIALLGVLTGVGVFLWSRRLFGTLGGFVSLGFLSVSPTFISLGGIIGADMPAACFFLFTLWSAWTLLHRVTPFTVGAFGLASALLLLSKMSGLAFAPVALLLLAVRLVRPRPLRYGFGWRADNTLTGRLPMAIVFTGAAMAATLVVWAVIWAGYGFRFSAAPAGAPGTYALDWHPSESMHGALASIVATCRQAHLLPEAFLFDLMNLTGLTGARPAFFLGEVGTVGWVTYFPFTFLAKSTPALIVGLLGVIVLGLRSWKMTKTPAHPEAAEPVEGFWKPYELVPIVVFLGCYALIVCSSNLNIGHRHLLPAYPLLFILLGGLAGVYVGKRRWPKLAVIALLGAGVVESLAIYPNALCYLSPLVGGRSHGYRLLVDSSLDWGQELPTVKRWLDAHPEDARTPPYFSYFGSGLPGAYGIRSRRLFGFYDWAPPLAEPLGPGTYLISATMLQPVYTTRQTEFGKISVIGPWCTPYEAWWQDHRRVIDAYFEARQAARAAQDRAALDDWERKNVALAAGLYGLGPKAIEGIEKRNQVHLLWTETLRVYDLLRFARLTHVLRGREPADTIAHAVLVYRLSADEVRASLEAPLANLPPGPVLKGRAPSLPMGRVPVGRP